MDNLEVDKFFERYNFPRLNQEETENMNKQLTSTEKWNLRLKKAQQIKVQDQMVSQVISIKHLKNREHLS